MNKGVTAKVGFGTRDPGPGARNSVANVRCGEVKVSETLQIHRPQRAGSRASSLCRRVPGPGSRVPPFASSESRVPPLQAGFTLIEVLAALALLAITFVVLLQALGASVHLTANADARTQAALWAQTKLDSSFVTTPPRRGVTRGKFNSRFRWRLDVHPWQPPLPVATPTQTRDKFARATEGSGLRLYRLDLIVSWGSGRYVRRAHFVTLRASNAAADTTGAAP